MKLTVTRQELLDKLGNIQNIVEKRNTMPILSHFLLDAKKAGSTITATDIETALREPISLEVSKDGRLCIPARKLFEIVKEVDGDITVETEDSEWIRVSAGKSSFRLACLPPDEFPSWPEMEQARELELEPASLSTMIEKTIYAAGESDTRYTLNGILFHLTDGKIILVGTDGHRMAVIESEAPSGAESKVIVPRKTVSELRKFLEAEGKVKIVIGKNNILFKIGDIEFLARLIEGTYPDYMQVIPKANEKKLKADRAAFIKALRRVSIMSRERSNAVKLELSSGTMTLSSSNPDIGEASDTVPIEYSGEELAIGFNARYLLDVLSAMAGESVLFELQDPLSPTLLREEGNEAYRCVAMPMRI
jgi:DNA polymerase-3 subunit beta